MEKIIKIGLLSIFGLVLMSLTACNTMQGAGQDIQQGGQAIQQAASSASH